ncbi:hypothetical protein [Oleiharenicola lentus]|uniref:hypothetical protein n=1 Tax=Oleiharenicola lentus TaxID=2508720 RepID=UPI003F67A4C8
MPAFIVAKERIVLILAGLAVIVTYFAMIDLKGISTDEGMRMAIIHGGEQYTSERVSPGATWEKVLATNSANAYQPLYFLFQNTLMRVAGTHQDNFFRAINIGFLGLSLMGLLKLSATWRITSRLFLIGLFSFTGFLCMHVLQIREYIVGVTFYVWSTWLVLKLDQRQLGRPWADIVWFSGYGVLLMLGFFVQSWVVFPAIAQGAFLVLRRRPAWLRFYAHLALSYIVVICTTMPYLRENQQKLNVGLWAHEGPSIWSQVANGFHLLFSGHQIGQSRFAEFIVWFWVLALSAALGLIFKLGEKMLSALAGIRRQAVLMLMCVTISLIFQIGYALKIETLSLWPRYFIIHHFFIVWLIALGFAALDEMRCDVKTSIRTRQISTAAIGLLAIGMLSSAVFQVRSYYADPYLDTSVSHKSDWRVMAAEISRTLQPDDVVVVSDYIIRGTLTFTRPIANRVVPLPALTAVDLNSIQRFVYLEHVRYKTDRANLLSELVRANFTSTQEIKLHSPGGTEVLPEWMLVVLTRD